MNDDDRFRVLIAAIISIDKRVSAGDALFLADTLIAQAEHPPAVAPHPAPKDSGKKK